MSDEIESGSLGEAPGDAGATSPPRRAPAENGPAPRRATTPLEGDHPGGAAAIACGCSCPAEQPRAALGIWDADPGCPLHGLDVMFALLEEG